MASPASNSPYMGPAFFTVQDRRFFFGRQSDTRRITDTVLTKRMSMVHALSGAGKTSLLRASVIPALDGMGFEACYMRPGPDPARTLRSAVLLRAVSPPKRELSALGAVVDAFGRYRAEQEPGADREELVEYILDMPLKAFREAYDAIPTDHPAHREMVVDLSDAVPDLLDVPQTHSVAGLSMAGRLLISHQGVEIYRHYLVRLCRLFSLPSYGLETPANLEDMSIGQIQVFLEDMAAGQDYAAAIAPLLDKGESLVEFFNTLSELLDGESSILPLRPVIIIDQFEEFFTRFGDGSDDFGQDFARLGSDFDYRVRDAFFAQIGALMQPEFWTGRDEVRCVISLRDDYVARLDNLELVCGEIALSQRNAIPLLSPLDIEDVVRGPAAAFGVQYADDLLLHLVDALTTERRYILPIKVQIVCSRLWRDHEDGPDPDLITLDALYRCVGSGREPKEAIHRIIENYVGETLGAMPLSERMDAIRVLASMMTLEGTREVVPYERLMEKTLVNREMRRAILKKLSDDSIISLEAHRGGRSVEIKHEFLLSSIHRNLRLSREKFPEWQILQNALETLERGLDLGRVHLEALVHHHEVLEPSLLSAGLAQRLFRLSALEPSHVPEETRKDWLACWAAWFDAPEAVDAAQAVRDAAVAEPGPDVMRRLAAAAGDLSEAARLPRDRVSNLIRNAITRMPAHSAIPVLMEVRRHVGRPG